MKNIVAAVALAVVAGTTFAAPASAASIHPAKVETTAQATKVGYYGYRYGYRPHYRRHYYRCYYGYGC